MKKTTQVMHAHIGNAVLELRRRLDWSQEQFAGEMQKGGRHTLARVVSKWERGADAPSPENRCVLAKIATRHKHEDLAALFRAPIMAWRLVAVLPSNFEEKT